MNRDKYPKGSKGMIQCLIKEHKSLLDEKLGVNLSWISPIEENQFKEYQLNGDFISTKIGLPQMHSTIFGLQDSLNGTDWQWMMSILYI